MSYAVNPCLNYCFPTVVKHHNPGNLLVKALKLGLWLQTLRIHNHDDMAESGAAVKSSCQAQLQYT